MRLNLPVVLFFLALAGCTTRPSPQSRMAAYIGTNEQALVQQFGVPDKHATVNGVQYLAYDWQRLEIDNGGAYGWFFPSIFESGLYPRIINDHSCEITFLLRNGRVFNFTLRGNHCY